MALINCRECGTKISDNAISCPSCGNPNQKSENRVGRTGFSTTTWVIIIIFLIFLISQCNKNSTNSDSNSDSNSYVDTVAAEAVDTMPTSGTVNVKKLSAKERKENIEKLTNMFLDTGMDVKVSVHGKNNEILELENALFNDVWFRKFETTGMFDNFHNLGFEKIILNDNYDYKKWISY